MSKKRTPLPPEIQEVMLIIRQGRLYDLKKWIQEGKPIRLPPDGTFRLSPLLAAIQTGFHTIVEDLLEALHKEEDMDRLLHEAVRMNRLDLIELLHRNGANPKTMCYDCVASSRDPLILRWFEDHGIDLVTDYPVAALGF